MRFEVLYGLSLIARSSWIAARASVVMASGGACPEVVMIAGLVNAATWTAKLASTAGPS
jgi:hypothetical protein